MMAWLKKVFDFFNENTASPEIFLNFNNMRKPKNYFDWLRRILGNLTRFRGNYLVILSGSMVYNVVKTPSALLCVALPATSYAAIEYAVGEGTVEIFGGKFYNRP